MNRFTHGGGLLWLAWRARRLGYRRAAATLARQGWRYWFGGAR